MAAATPVAIPQGRPPRSAQLHNFSLNKPTTARVTPTVFVVENDVHLRQSLELLIRASGWESETFASGHEFLAHPRSAAPCCLVLDVNLPGLNGLELQECISAERSQLPLIFVTNHSDVHVAVRAMKSGAFEFLMRPVDGDVLVKAIGQAIRRSEVVLGREEELRGLRDKYDSLTPREREVLRFVVSGHSNKVVGGELGISEITVKMHRGNVMRKMQASSFAHLVNMASRLRVSKPLLASTVSACSF